MQIKRGDLFYVNLAPTQGSEQAGARPVLVVQNDVGNEYAPTVIIAPLTSTVFSKRYPTNISIPKSAIGLREHSTALLSQIRTIDKTRLQRRLGHLPPTLMHHVDHAIKISLGLL